eukprot:4253145-Prymnesium_polylepis.1
MQPNPEGGAPFLRSPRLVACASRFTWSGVCGGIVDSVGLGHFCFTHYGGRETRRFSVVVRSGCRGIGCRECTGRCERILVDLCPEGSAE